MKLHALDLHRPMSQTHDHSVVCARGNFKTIRKTGGIHDQGMITSRGEILFESCEDGPAIMKHCRRFPVKELGSAHHASAECLSDRLMAETYAQNRSLSAEMFDDVQRYSRLIRRPRARRNDYAIGFQLRINLGDCHF